MIAVKYVRQHQQIDVSVTPGTLAALQALVKTGLFGRTVSEVAEGFIRDRVRQHTLEGWLPMPRGKRR